MAISMNRPVVLTIIGTRPEAIKMAPVIAALRNRPALEVKICVTGQHREMLDQMMAIFSLTADDDLQVMGKNQDLASLTAGLLLKMHPVFERWKPALLLVQGDTTSSMAAALAGFYASIPIGHVEAGLRTGDTRSEEVV